MSFRRYLAIALLAVASISAVACTSPTAPKYGDPIAPPPAPGR